jgi:uncharacterized protein YkwD
MTYYNRMIKQIAETTGIILIAIFLVLLAAGVIKIQITTNKHQIPAASSTKWTDVILARTNEERQKVGCNSVMINKDLEAAAYERAEYLATFENISEKAHEGWDQTVRKHFKFRTAGENLAQGFPSESSMFDALMNSTTHRDNITDCDFTLIGIGRAGDIVVQEFAKPL